MARNKTSWVVWLRRLSQTAFVFAFIYLFLQTAYHPVNRSGRGVDLFFQFDPLVLLTSWIASHQVASGLFFALITVAITFLAGRWFCGWICPFGALHNLVTAVRARGAKLRVASSTFSPRQHIKYYVLLALVVCSLLGLNLAGWIDPFSFLFRGTAMVAYPMLDDATKSSFGWVYQTDPAIRSFHLTSVTEPVYDVLRHNVLAAAQPHFTGTFLLAILFFGMLLLNLHRTRFWCRYVCPLGALLGVVGKNPLVQIKRDEAACNGCHICVENCQGGANPDSSAWKPTECMYCWNCQSACPHHAITFTIHVPGGQR